MLPYRRISHKKIGFFKAKMTKLLLIMLPNRCIITNVSYKILINDMFENLILGGF